MEKSFEMDFDEWELLPDARHTFVDFGLEAEKELLISKNIDINYFSNDKNSSPLVEEKEECKDICVVPPTPQIPMILADHEDVTSVVLFKKMKDDEFVDMKIESPRISTKGTIMPPVDPEQMMFDSEEEKEDDEDEMFYTDEKTSEKPDIKEKQIGLKIWKWRVMGSVGALCSIGVAAATLCIFILGGRQLQKHQHQNQKIQFQIYTDEKRINQVVQQATRLNHALSAARGVPMTRAHISFGGYYDGL